MLPSTMSPDHGEPCLQKAGVHRASSLSDGQREKAETHAEPCTNPMFRQSWHGKAQGRAEGSQISSRKESGGMPQGSAPPAT